MTEIKPYYAIVYKSYGQILGIVQNDVGYAIFFLPMYIFYH